MVTEEYITQMKKLHHKKGDGRSESIRNYCRYVCCVGDQKSWINCTVKDCFLYDFRLPKWDSIKKQKSDEKRLSLHGGVVKNEILEEIKGNKLLEFKDDN